MMKPERLHGPCISVLLPVWNGAEFLDESLWSIRCQTFKDFELIAVDDGSTDATPAILHRHAAEDDRIQIIRLNHSGIVAALNTGLKAASAGLVARMDADDVALPERFEAQVASLRARPGVAALGTAVELIDRAGRSLSFERFPLTAQDIRRTLLERCCLAHPTVMMVRDAVLAVGGYRTAFAGCEDYDLWLRLSEGQDLENLPRPLLRYRVHPGQSAWRASEIKFVSENVARYLSQLRRSGAGEPVIDFAVSPARETLLGLGWTNAQINRQIFDYAMGVARRAEAFGDYSSAVANLRLAAQQAGVPYRSRLRRGLLEARVRLRNQLGKRKPNSAWIGRAPVPGR